MYFKEEEEKKISNRLGGISSGLVCPFRCEPTHPSSRADLFASFKVSAARDFGLRGQVSRHAARKAGWVRQQLPTLPNLHYWLLIKDLGRGYSEGAPKGLAAGRDWR